MTREELEASFDLQLHQMLEKGGVAYSYRSSVDPRLEKRVFRTRAGEPTQISYLLDGKKVADLDEAAELLSRLS
jgi:hypothetical protein